MDDIHQAERHRAELKSSDPLLERVASATCLSRGRLVADLPDGRREKAAVPERRRNGGTISRETECGPGGAALSKGAPVENTIEARAGG